MNKKVDKIEVEQKYDEIRPPALNVAFERVYMQDLVFKIPEASRGLVQELSSGMS